MNKETKELRNAFLKEGVIGVQKKIKEINTRKFGGSSEANKR